MTTTTSRAKRAAAKSQPKAKAKAKAATTPLDLDHQADADDQPSDVDMDDQDDDNDNNNNSDKEDDDDDGVQDDANKMDVDDHAVTTSSSRRSSARLRTRVSTTAAKSTPPPKTPKVSKTAKPKAKATTTTSTPTAKRGRKPKAATAAASDELRHSDQDENKSDTGDLSDEDSHHGDNDDDDDDDDGDDHPPAKRSSRRSATAKKPSAASATPTFKKPVLPASRSTKTKTTTTPSAGGRRKRGTVVRLDLDDSGLWDAVTTPNVAMSGIVKQWLTEYHVRPSDALLAVVNMMIAATGCTETISPARFEDQDAVPDYVEELQMHMTSSDAATSTSTGAGYPLISRTKAHKVHMQAFFSFFTHLITSDDDALWDDVLLQVVQQWLAAMVSSPLRAFRHTATALGLHLASTLCTPLANEKHAYHDQVVDTHSALYDTIFVHRYRDVDPNLRKECMRALATWVERVPDRFLDPTYLRYFGWLLNDQDAGVRSVVLECLAQLYANPALVPGLRLFTERFKPRMLQIATADVDPTVQRAGVALVCLVYHMGVLSADEVDTLCALVFSKHVQGAHMPETLVGVWKEETEPMDWPRLVEWIAGLLGQVYPEAQVAVDNPKADGDDASGSDTDDGDDALGMPIRKSRTATLMTVDALQCDHALDMLVAGVPTLPLFSSPEPALAHLRRTDTALAHEHLLLALVCSLAQHARDTVGRTLVGHLPALLAKYKADDTALVFLFRAARAGVPTDAWLAATTAVLDSVLAAGVAAMKRDAKPLVLDEVARLFGGLSARSETSVHVAPFVRKLVAEGCASERPATVAAVLKVVKLPEDVLVGEVQAMVDALEVGSVERLVSRFMVAMQQASLTLLGDKESEPKDTDDGEQDNEAKLPPTLPADLRHDVQDIVQECVDVLSDADLYSARTRVAAANVLMECASVFDGIDLDDRALALLEQLIAARIKSLVMADGQEDLAVQTDPLANPTLAFLESDQALVRMFAKLVGVGAIDAAYAPTVLQFYRRPPVPASERDDDVGPAPWSVDELARQLTNQADRVVMGAVLEKVPEATLVQVCLSAIQRAFRLSEADKEVKVSGQEDVKPSHVAEAQGEPDRPGAVPRLAKSLADVFKRRKTANVKPVIAYGAQWVVEQFEPTDMPERPAPKNKTKKAKKAKDVPEGGEGGDDAMEVDQQPDDMFAKSDDEASASDREDDQEGEQADEDDAEMQEYQVQLEAFHDRLNTALRNSSPIVKALKEFVPVLSISDARALYRQFRGSMVLEPLLPALAKKANVKHEPVIVHGHGGGMVLAATAAATGAKKRTGAASTRTPRSKRSTTSATAKRTTRVSRPKRPQAAKKKKAAWEAVLPGMSSDDDDEDHIQDSDHDEEHHATPTSTTAATGSRARGRKRAKPDSDSDEEGAAPATTHRARATGSRTSARRKAPVVTTAPPESHSDEEREDQEQDEGDEPDPPIKRRKFM